MDSKNDLNSVNDKIQANIQTIQQIEASRIIKALFCTKVDCYNAPQKCCNCQSYIMLECKGRPQK